MPSDVVQDATAQEVTPACAQRGSGHLVDPALVLDAEPG